MGSGTGFFSLFSSCVHIYIILFQKPEDSDPASLGYKTREYRFIRNHLTREEALRTCPQLAKNRVSDQVFVNKVEKTPQLLKFHPYTSHLAVMHKSEWRYVPSHLAVSGGPCDSHDFFLAVCGILRRALGWWLTITLQHASLPLSSSIHTTYLS